MRFGSDFIEKVRDGSDIVEIIGQFTQLKPSGANLTGLCPFPDHREKTPSFSVSPTKQVYYCFGCKKAGNVFTFVEQIQGLSFPEVIEYLARKAGIPLPEKANAQDEANHKSDEDAKKLLFKISDFAAQVFKSRLAKSADDSPVKIYLANRGFSQETIERFGIGHATNSWDYLTNALESKKVPAAASASLGLIKARSQGKSGYFDLFRDRLMFPILSVTGQTIGFGGRALGSDPPKYLNSPDSPIFHKGKVFYGLHETAKFIRAQDQAIVVEGYTDFLSLYQAGIQNVVATLGTALTVDHAKILKRYTKNVVVLFDGDEAGQAAAERAAPIFLAQGLFPRGLILSEEYDPDEFVREKGADALKGLLDTAPELFSLLLLRHFKGFQGSQVERVALLDLFSPLLQATSDGRLRDLYTAELAEWLRLDKKWVLNSIQKGGLEFATSKSRSTSVEDEKRIQKEPEADKDGIIVVKNPPRAELELLNLALLERDYLDEILAANIVSQFNHDGVKEIFMRIERLYRQMPNEFDKLTGLLTTQVRPAAVLSLHLDKPFADISKEGAKKLISDCSRRVRETFLREKQKEISSHLRGLRSNDQIEQLEQIMNIQKNRRALKNDLEPN